MALDDQSFFNNADSFSMAFDMAWKTFDQGNGDSKIDQETKIKAILARLEKHPFLISSPRRAEDIIKFRLRLLNLN